MNRVVVGEMRRKWEVMGDRKRRLNMGIKMRGNKERGSI